MFKEAFQNRQLTNNVDNNETSTYILLNTFL